MLRQWSFAKVALLSAGWVAVCVVAAVAWLLIPAWLAYNRSDGSGGVGAVSFGINVFMLAIPLAPPVLLVVAWLLARWR
jgi:hypothetical protein